MQNLLCHIYPINFPKLAVLIDFTRLAEREWREDPARLVFFALADAAGMQGGM
jgi:hypothetical protein